MTFLRRTAQLVNDLKTLQLIRGEDRASLTLLGKEYNFYITLEDHCLINDINTIERACKDEFTGEENIEVGVIEEKDVVRIYIREKEE